MQQKVLYIEDNPDNMLLVQRAIEAAGYQFIGAEDGLSGLQMANELLPNVVLLDINLPDIDGYEIARRLRASTIHLLSKVPIIAVTANALKGDQDKAMAAGCDIYLSKPINIRQLWGTLEDLLKDD
jgi:two-component system cell cycle response regulator DivK